MKLKSMNTHKIFTTKPKFSMECRNMLGPYVRNIHDMSGVFVLRIWTGSTARVKGKNVKLSVCPIKHHAMKTYGGVEV
jgi:hypothetical protein